MKNEDIGAEDVLQRENLLKDVSGEIETKMMMTTFY